MSGVVYVDKSAAVLQALQDRARVGLLKAAVQYQQAVREELKRGHSAATLGVQSGLLRNSIQIDDRRLAQLEVRIGTNLPYARVHEFGKPIKAGKTSKYLTIPLGETARKLRRRVRSLREVVGLFAFKSKRGSLLLARRKGKRGKLQVLFKLVESIILPARPYMRPAFARVKQQLLDTITRAVRERME